VIYRSGHISTKKERKKEKRKKVRKGAVTVVGKGKVKDVLHEHFPRNSGECLSDNPNLFLMTLIRRSSGVRPDIFKQNYVHSNLLTKFNNISYYSRYSLTCFCTMIHYLVLSLQTSRPCTLKDCELYTHLCYNIESHIDSQFMLWHLLFLVRREISLQAIGLILP
jgi:hypothetical protein